VTAGPGDVRYTRSDEYDIAYDVVGDGAVDIVHVPGILTTLEAQTTYPPLTRFYESLTRFARVIRLDKRGTGLSDRLPPGTTPTIEQRIDDVRAVMDAAGSSSAALIGGADGGPVAMVFAATYPERVRALVLNATAARVTAAPDYPWAPSAAEHYRRLDLLQRGWGTGVLAASFGLTDEVDRRAIARLERLAATPSAAADIFRATAATDIRDVLETISAPTLIVHHTDHPLWPIEGARYLVEHIPNASLVELPGQPETFVDSIDHRPQLAPLIEEFITGQRPAPQTDRVLKTVLFTDIVASTERAAELGDRRWTELLNAHDAAVRDAIERNRGQQIKTTGDGAFAVFDGPARAIACATTIVTEADRLGLSVRVGIHSGECEQRGDDYAGIAVHIGARVASAASPDEILVTGTVRDLVAGSGITFADRGRKTLRGAGEWQLLAVSP
jgi:class 3 adenylate cyclase/pimeloyl-ACP methyl ester carboxylesterase